MVYILGGLMQNKKFKKRILKEYLQLTHKVLNTSSMIDENNYYELSRNIERDVQRMIGRLKYR